MECKKSQFEGFYFFVHLIHEEITSKNEQTGKWIQLLTKRTRGWRPRKAAALDESGLQSTLIPISLWTK